MRRVRWRRAKRRPWYLASTLLLVLLAVSCGGSSKSDAQQASDDLNAGLKAQVEGKTQEAIDDYNKVLVHDPRNKYAYYNLGLIEEQAGRVTSAEQHYRTALEIDPEFEPALFNLAIIRTGPAPMEAADLYRHVITIQPNNVSAHLNLGYVLRTLGQKTEASAEFAKALALDPSIASRIPPDGLASPKPTPKTP